MPRPEQVSGIQALAWLNAIAEDNSGDKSEGENVCKGLDQGSANSDQVRPTWEVISLAESNSETDMNDLEQTGSESCQLVSSGTGSNDTSIAAQAQGDGLTLNTLKIGLVAKSGTKWEYINFFSESQGRLQTENVLIENKRR